jgi:hypothetical protein
MSHESYVLPLLSPHNHKLSHFIRRIRISRSRLINIKLKRNGEVFVVQVSCVLVFVFVFVLALDVGFLFLSAFREDPSMFHVSCKEPVPVLIRL